MTDTRSDRRAGPATALVVAGAVLVGLLLLTFLLLGVLGDDDEPAAGRQPVQERVDEDAYEAVSVGQSKEDVLRSLRPAEPFGAEQLAQYQLREPETTAAECVYYESEGGSADDLYRFCFAEDRLVDKTVVLPPDDGVTGG